ncbi:MAG: Thymidylate kinase [uncultured Thermomicrobiales bacterium]|uniref:Thymidylate kinase n=1 Tax=uncultured Thermomicrobiales bacterium TaxID=1645740 RepID=A0A6J4VE76_9BACT|nr:MAG: Thymidylate kinase [uncultured Thermomicrobiales bacterium]
MQGLFVSFEGPEGAGKTTQARRLAEDLRSEGHDVVLTREPGGTPLAEAVRGLVLRHAESGGVPMSAATEALLFTAARADHVDRLIRPALDAGRVVICDRFTGSTLAYQGGGRGLDADALTAAQELATGGLRPDLTLLLDLPVRDGLDRRFGDGEGDTPNRMDAESEAFHERVRATYHRLAAAEGSTWVIVDAGRPPVAVAAAIGDTVRSVLRNRRTSDRRVPHQAVETGRP